MTTIESNKSPYLIYSLVLLFFFGTVLFFFEEKMEPEPPAPEILPPEPEPIPDFANILDVELKKQQFFDFVEPYVHKVNEGIAQQRQRLLTIMDSLDQGDNISNRDLRFLSTLAEQYELETEDLTNEDFLSVLLRRVDQIPASLALAQAANESAWGTSRFAQDGYNFFGQWCYTDGCGIVPNGRRDGDIHEVRSFDSVEDSVQAYIHNLNTFPSYQMLRRIRQQLRQQGRPLDGVALADGLESYSERGLDYIEELQVMIYTNNLLGRDRAIPGQPD
jgi:Bax protein